MILNSLLDIFEPFGHTPLPQTNCGMALNRLLNLTPVFGKFCKHIEYVGIVQLLVSGSAVYAILYSSKVKMTVPTGWCLSDPASWPPYPTNPIGTFYKQIPRTLEYHPVPGNGIPSKIGIPIEVLPTVTITVGIRCCTVTGLTNVAAATCPKWHLVSVYPSYYSSEALAAGITPAYVAGITQCFESQQV